MRTLFPPELRTMAAVPRWSIMMTTLKQSVAEHTFFVMVYSLMVAKLIHWDGPPGYLMFNAAMHDNDETITGDIVGTVRKVVLDREATEEFLYDKTSERMEGLFDEYEQMAEEQGSETLHEVDAIVAVADKLDAVLFMIDNQKVGNLMVRAAIEGNMKGLEAAWRALPAPKDELDYLWQTHMLPSIDAHYERGGRGVMPGVVL